MLCPSLRICKQVTKELLREGKTFFRGIAICKQPSSCNIFGVYVHHKLTGAIVVQVMASDP